MRDMMRRALAPIEGRVRLMLARGHVLLVDDAPSAQELQVELLEDEQHDGVERLQNYGFSAAPHPGAEAVVACIGGLRSHAIALVVEDRRYRLKGLAAGEVALYDDLGNVVKLGRARIEITAASQIAITAPDGVTIAADVAITGAVAITGDVSITGALAASVDVTAAAISLKTHKHGGVQAGAAQTGLPA